MTMEIISVSDYGVIGEGDPDQDTLVFKLAFDDAKRHPSRWIGIPAGEYHINETLLYRTTDREAPGLTLFGAGMYNTILVNCVGDGPLLRLRGGVHSFNKQYGSRIADFSIVSPATAAAKVSSKRMVDKKITPLSNRGTGTARNRFKSIGTDSPQNRSDMLSETQLEPPSIFPDPSARRAGIEFQCAWHCDMERVRVQGLDRNGILVVSDAGDGAGEEDSSAYLRFKNCIIKHNAGHGMNFSSASGTLGIEHVSIVNCDITGNALGGIRGVGVGTFAVQGCGIGANGGGEGGTGGIYIGYDGIDSHHITIKGCEMGNNTSPASIWLETSVCGEISHSRFVKTYFENDEKGVVVGPLPGNPNHGSVREFACRQNWFAIDYEEVGENTGVYIVDTPYTALNISSIVRNFYIEKNRFAHFFLNPAYEAMVKKLEVAGDVDPNWYVFDDKSDRIGF